MAGLLDDASEWSAKLSNLQEALALAENFDVTFERPKTLPNGVELQLFWLSDTERRLVPVHWGEHTTQEKQQFQVRQVNANGTIGQLWENFEMARGNELTGFGNTFTVSQHPLDKVVVHFVPPPNAQELQLFWDPRIRGVSEEQQLQALVAVEWGTQLTRVGHQFQVRTSPRDGPTALVQEWTILSVEKTTYELSSRHGEVADEHIELQVEIIEPEPGNHPGVSLQLYWVPPTVGLTAELEQLVAVNWGWHSTWPGHIFQVRNTQTQEVLVTHHIELTSKRYEL